MKKRGEKLGAQLIKNLLNPMRKWGRKPIIWYFVYCFVKVKNLQNLARKIGKKTWYWLKIGTRSFGLKAWAQHPKKICF